MICLDTSVALAQLLAEDRTPTAALSAKTLVSSRLLPCKLWTRVRARGLARSHADDVRQILGRIDYLAQFSTVRPLKRLKSFTFAVTSVPSFVCAMDAMCPSTNRAGLPSFSSRARSTPCHRADARSYESTSNDASTTSRK